MEKSIEAELDIATELRQFCQKNMIESEKNIPELVSKKKKMPEKEEGNRRKRTK